jgi:hypothetical protein
MIYKIVARNAVEATKSVRAAWPTMRVPIGHLNYRPRLKVRGSKLPSARVVRKQLPAARQ